MKEGNRFKKKEDPLYTRRMNGRRVTDGPRWRRRRRIACAASTSRVSTHFDDCSDDRNPINEIVLGFQTSSSFKWRLAKINLETFEVFLWLIHENWVPTKRRFAKWKKISWFLSSFMNESTFSAKENHKSH